MTRRELLNRSALFMGYAVSVGTLSDLFVACSRKAGQDALNWEPVSLTEEQAATLAEICETILPRTKTPGAKDLGVPQFVDRMLRDLLSPDDQKQFVEGLEAVNQTAQTAHGQDFVGCPPAQREALLLALDREAAPPPLSLWGITLEETPPTTFYRRLKGLTLLGYYTDEKIGKGVFRYDPTPGEFIPCMPLEGKNAWTE